MASSERCGLRLDPKSREKNEDMRDPLPGFSP